MWCLSSLCTVCGAFLHMMKHQDNLVLEFFPRLMMEAINFLHEICKFANRSEARLTSTDMMSCLESILIGKSH